MRWIILLTLFLGCDTPKPEPVSVPQPIDYGIPLYQSESFREEFEQWDLKLLHTFVDNEEITFVAEYEHFKRIRPHWSEDRLIKYTQACYEISKDVYRQRVQ